MEIFDFIKANYEFFVGAAGSLFTYIGLGKLKRTVQKDEININSRDLMLSQIEKLNIKLTELLDKRIQDHREKTNLEIKIERLRKECPDCVGRILEIIQNEEQGRT